MKIQHESESLVIFESSLYRTTTTLVIGADYLLLVDPNWLPIEVAFIANYVARYSAGRQSYLLFTHSDYDHIIAYEQFADFTVIASQAFVDNPEPAKVLAEIRTFDQEYYIERAYAISYPVVDIPVATDGFIVPLGKSDELVLFQAPGHNADGIFGWVDGKAILIVGDYLCNVEFPFIYHSLEAYRETLGKLLTKLRQLDVDWMISGHGDATSSKSTMLLRVAEAKRYLDQLEAQVNTSETFPLEEWLAPYPWPAGLRKAHENNVKLVRKELGII